MATQRQPREIHTHPLFFDPLEPDGSNYLGWNIDMRAYLRAEELDATIDSSMNKQFFCHKPGAIGSASA
jgi:hypothetical protein